MNCSEATKLIPLKVGGDLDSDVLVDLTEHLGTCPECCAIVEEYEHTHSIFRLVRDTSPAPQGAPDDFIRSVSRAIRIEQEGRATPRWGLWVPGFARAAALLVLALGGGFFAREFFVPAQDNPAVTTTTGHLKVITPSGKTITLSKLMKIFSKKEFHLIATDPANPYQVEAPSGKTITLAEGIKAFPKNRYRLVIWDRKYPGPFTSGPAINNAVNTMLAEEKRRSLYPYSVERFEPTRDLPDF